MKTPARRGWRIAKMYQTASASATGRRLLRAARAHTAPPVGPLYTLSLTAISKDPAMSGWRSAPPLPVGPQVARLAGFLA